MLIRGIFHFYWKNWACRNYSRINYCKSRSFLPSAWKAKVYFIFFFSLGLFTFGVGNLFECSFLHLNLLVFDKLSEYSIFQKIQMFQNIHKIQILFLIHFFNWIFLTKFNFFEKFIFSKKILNSHEILVLRKASVKPQFYLFIGTEMSDLYSAAQNASRPQ